MVRTFVLLAALGCSLAARVSPIPTRKVVPCPMTLQCCEFCVEKYFCPTTKECIRSEVRYAACDVAVCGPTSAGGKGAPAGGHGKGGGPLQEKYEPIPPGKPLVWQKAGNSLVFFVIGDWGGSSDATPVTPSQKKTADAMGRLERS